VTVPAACAVDEQLIGLAAAQPTRAQDNPGATHTTINVMT